MKKANFGLIAAILFLTLAVGSAFAETPQLPGMVEGTGTHFEVTDSTYLNISLNSSEPIKAMLQSAPKMVMMYVESTSGASSTAITLSEFAPNTTYYKYEDDFHNPVEFITDEIGGYSYTQDLSKEHVVFIQTEKSTKFLIDDATGGDCYSIGAWDAGTKTCTLTMDVIDLIQIDDSGIVLEGAGHAVSGDISGMGVYSTGKTGITINNLNVESLFAGIHLVNCSNNNITSNTISGSYHGIYLLNSENNTIEENTTNSNIAGLFLYLSNYTTVKYNTLSNNSVYGIVIASNNNQVYNNNFIENGTPSGAQAEVYGTGNTFNLDAPVGGNYWSDHNNYDGDNDGFADTVYFFTGGHDNLPLAKPFVQEEEPQDEVPPVTTIVLSGTEGNNGWYVSDVEAALTATDEGGTVASTEYSFDEANWNAYTAPFSISEEGTAAIYFRSTDDSGNIEETKNQIVKIDKTAPEITYTKTPEANANGWNNSDVTIQFECTDETSGIAECTPDTTITTEGTTQTTGTATDQAGNTTSITTTETNIDKTQPSIGIATPQTDGIYSIGTALDFSAEDLLSGIAGVAGELTNTNGEILSVESGFAPEPGAYTLIVRAEDSAGNPAESNPVPFVVYDPKGGFATGGGWFYPDAESNLPEEGRAIFGFVTGYKKGNSIGKLLFHYKVNPQCEKAGKNKPACKETNLTLNSKTIDWLVVSGASAEFQGTGTINGTGLYTFRATAKDNGKPKASTDSFDIKIWKGTNTEAEPLYKAKNTLEGGNIVIHKK